MLRPAVPPFVAGRPRANGRLKLPFLTPSPDRRRLPAGSGPLEETESSRELHRTTPDMERALGALKDFTRRDILLRFYADHKPRTIDEVAQASGIHRSVAFDHLERLVALGYLEIERRRGLPGKPAKIYRLAAGPVQISHPMRRYDVLAEALARAFGGEAEAIKEAGRALGRSLARPGSGSASFMSALKPVVEMGGDYERGPSHTVVCTNCLFADVCRRVPGICAFHAGLIEGLTGLESRVESLGFHGPSGCAYRVA